MEINKYIEERLAVLEDFKSQLPLKTIPSLYKPIDYILNLGGKRIRPLLVLMCAELFDELNENVLNSAWAIEFFHNFTLMHDDIMDAAPLRRNKATVHTHFSTNAAILSGDAMNIFSNMLFSTLPDSMLPKVLREFNKVALEVCEGQQMDMDFETEKNPNYFEYLEMIKLKTSVLLAYSCLLGARVQNTNDETAQNLYVFGLNLGIAFQLLDDYLDAFGDSPKVGKQSGGDILMNKKTFLYFKTLDELNEVDKNNFIQIYHSNIEQKVKEVKAIMEQKNIPELVKEEINKYTQMALEALNIVSVEDAKKEPLRELTFALLHRNY